MLAIVIVMLLLALVFAATLFVLVIVDVIFGLSREAPAGPSRSNVAQSLPRRNSTTVAAKNPTFDHRRSPAAYEEECFV